MSDELYLSEEQLAPAAKPLSADDMIADATRKSLDELKSLGINFEFAKLQQAVTQLARAVFNDLGDGVATAGGVVGQPDGRPYVIGLPFSTGTLLLSWNEPPDGWIVCSGQEVDKVQYLELHDVFVNRNLYFGVPSNEENFALPRREDLPPTSTAARWSLGYAAGVGDLRQPTVLNGFLYECTAAAVTTGEPTWPLGIGETVTEAAGPTWKCKRKLPEWMIRT